MVWYRWRFGRLAMGYRENGTWEVRDGWGTWKHVGFGLFWLARKR